MKSSYCRLANVEFLRIVFTIFVLVTHFFGNVFKIWTSGNQGVEFFFILSGYLLALTYKPDRGIIAYAQSKFVRFVPLVVFGGFLCSGGWSSLRGIFMLQGTGLYVNTPNTPAWFIGTLFWTSILYLSFFKALDEKTRNLMIGIVVAVACMCISKWRMLHDFIPYEMLRGISCVGIGCLLAQCCRSDSTRAGLDKWSWGYTIAEVLLLSYILVGCFNRNVYLLLGAWIFRPITLTLLLWLFIKKRGFISNLCDRPIFIHLAKYSLSVYLTHWCFGTTVRSFVQSNYPGWLESNVELSISIAMVGSCLLGVLAHHLVEKPCTRHLNNWLTRFKEDTLVNR